VRPIDLAFSRMKRIYGDVGGCKSCPKMMALRDSTIARGAPARSEGLHGDLGAYARLSRWIRKRHFRAGLGHFL